MIISKESNVSSNKWHHQNIKVEKSSNATLIDSAAVSLFIILGPLRGIQISSMLILNPYHGY